MFKEALADIRKLKENIEAIPTITEEQISNSTQDGIHIPASSNTPLGHIRINQLPVAQTKGRNKMAKNNKSDTRVRRPTSTYT